MDQIRLVTLNMFLRPPGIHTNSSDYKDLRTQLLIDQILNNFDIICLQEVFSTLSSRKDLIIFEAAKRGLLFSHESSTPNPFYGHFTDGGLLILSRFPILCRDEILFDEGMSSDRLSSKGVIYVKVKIGEEVLNVFTTHTQASYQTRDASEYLRYRIIRRGQIRQLKAFVENKVGKCEAAIVAGDLNVDGREQLKKPVYEFELQDDYYHFWNIISNGDSEIVDLIRMKYKESLATYGILNSHGEPLEKTLTGKEELGINQCLDYILVKNPKVITNQFLKFDINSIQVEPFYVKNQFVTQISDHAGVKFSFKLSKTSD